MDHVDNIIKQWHKERSSLDVSSMEVVGRIKRLSLVFGHEMEKTFNNFGLNNASFDVLATLRRAGPPYALSPGALIDSTMVSSGTMTNRIDRLEKSGFITRTQRQHDKRSFMISLTGTGYDLIDEMLGEHVATLDHLTQMLSTQEKNALNTLLRKMALHFEHANI